MKRKNLWKKSLALGLFLGATTMGTSSVAFAQQDVLLDDGEVHVENYDFTTRPSEWVQVAILNGSSLNGLIVGQDQNLEIMVDGSIKKGDLNFSSTEVYGGGSTTVKLENNATWDGNVLLDAELNTAIYYNSEITDSTFTGNIVGTDSDVNMQLSNSGWDGDLQLNTTSGNNGITSSANIRLENG